MGGSMDVNFESHLHGDDNSSSRVGLFGASNNRVSSNLRWSDMLGVGKDEPLHDLIPYAPPGLVGGKKLTVFSDDEVEDDVHRCEKLVVGCFVGKRLPFLMVRNFAKRVWKLKGEMKMTLLGDAVFVFEFDSAEDRAMALEHGCLFISGQPFVVGPWSLMIEQELAELKTIPIWINLRNVRLHLWNSKGLGWVVKNRKRGRNKNSNQQKSSTAGLDGASTSGTANMVEVPIMMNNKFHQLTEEGTGEFMEVVMTTTTKDNHRLTPFGSNDTADGSQVERLDEGQKENDGARTHFLPKSSIQGKNMLNVKAAEKKSPK
ncbi:hypothetical protein C5167_025926, partial [Papaver somniferum]